MQTKGLRVVYAFLVIVLDRKFGECSSRKARIDLSYKPHLGDDADSVAKFIGEKIWGSATKQLHEIEVDLSSSLFGDDKVGIISKDVFPNVHETLEGCDPTKIHLTARMNRLTPVGVSNLLEIICSKPASEQEEEKEQSKTEGVAETSNSTDPGKLSQFHRRWYVQSLDLSLNDFHPEMKGSKKFLVALRSIFEDSETCPSIIRLESCSLGPAACRAIGKGIMTRYKDNNKEVLQQNKRPMSLHLCGNEGLGDSGAAALAAALRTMKARGEIFDILDLSWCDIGDAGAEAIAMALETNPGCIRHLNLSHNSITDEGVSAIAKALTQVSNVPLLQSLNFNGNDVGDHGASEISKVVGTGQLSELSLRCCHIHADGAQAFGQAIKAMSNKPNKVNLVKIDLSGNPIGVLRKKSKAGGKYSASMLKSKASATTASYMNFLGKSIKSGLKDVGLDGVLSNGSPSAESDDEEEEQMGFEGDSLAEDGDLTDPSKARCGAKSFTGVFFDDDDNDEENGDAKTSKLVPSTVKCELAFRHCSLDQGAADALAAAVLRSKEKLGIDMKVDAGMNTVLEEAMIEALQDSSDEYGHLEEMADRHMDVMEALRVAEERAAEAAKAAAERASASSMGWDDQYDEFGFSHANDYDSDAAYDNEDDSYAY
mmetsp:Transcript_17840/g.27562  ORF Transcript_17840/g.27562 Transcript_17840/m.27562 type:complete len:655 (-) Transcript_17840:116-2080(-)|eukprot:CAMPEP_0195306046 /NCGR_PEP_ID=MMETSP0707-20130614/36999_1 /TAXON_ID=33640 /ORGANISM="Asterionellopsis glacialis, Strain CCMP134" /LENGTH=654 /DNA_ID=CAMNT_0040370255 /DNA_START=39 /DNA_END=2003 /DNA_ORIENTATION=+